MAQSLAFSEEFAVTFRALMLNVLQREAETTVRLFEAIPRDRHEFRPGAGARSAWELAWHIAADVWFLEGIARCGFERDPDLRNANPNADGRELAAWYASRHAAALDAILAIPPADLAAPLTIGGVADRSGIGFPAFLYLLFAQNHTVHHRGQLSAYLRAMGAEVPVVYG